MNTPKLSLLSELNPGDLYIANTHKGLETMLFGI